MKSVRMSRDFDYRPTLHRMTSYRGGKTYHRVPEAAAAAIEAAGAGEVVGRASTSAPAAGVTTRRRRARG